MTALGLAFCVVIVVTWVLWFRAGVQYGKSKSPPPNVVGIASRDFRAGEMVHAGEIFTSGTVTLHLQDADE